MISCLPQSLPWLRSRQRERAGMKMPSRIPVPPRERCAHPYAACSTRRSANPGRYPARGVHRASPVVLSTAPRTCHAPTQCASGQRFRPRRGYPRRAAYFSSISHDISRITLTGSLCFSRDRAGDLYVSAHLLCCIAGEKEFDISVGWATHRARAAADCPLNGGWHGGGRHARTVPNAGGGVCASSHIARDCAVMSCGPGTGGNDYTRPTVRA